MTREDIEDLFEDVTGHNIAHGDKSEITTMYISPDDVVEFAQRISAHEKYMHADLLEICEMLIQLETSNENWLVQLGTTIRQTRKAIAKARGQ
jgi:dsDNA-specific endonuclease/ATPase MutS2